MSSEKFFVCLDNPSKCFVAGDTVTGRIVIRCKKRKRISGLLVECIGKSEVKTSDIHVGHDMTMDLFRDSETFFHQKIQLIKNYAGRKKETLAEGTHEFDFRFVLAHNAPSSIVGQLGRISYEIKAVLKECWKSDQLCGLQFKVNSSLDLLKGSIPITIGTERLSMLSSVNLNQRGQQPPPYTVFAPPRYGDALMVSN